MSDYKPITGELRKYATVSWDPWPDARDRLYQMCDRIDAIHAGLERENAELRERLAKMDNVGESMQGRITHELRELTADPLLGYASKMVLAEVITGIADRIDAEHERQLEVLYRDMSDAEYVKLPKDADGEPIHIGDALKDGAEFKSEGVVECLMLDKSGWFVGFGNGWTDVTIHEWHHHHAQTVEDVLREFALKVAGEECMTMRMGIVEEYAAKLQLVGDAS